MSNFDRALSMNGLIWEPKLNTTILGIISSLRDNFKIYSFLVRILVGSIYWTHLVYI